MHFHTLINQERLARTFIQLCETDSPSGEEGRMAALVTEMLCAFGAPLPFEDDSATKTGSQCGNLLFRFDHGNVEQEPLFFCCHLDTVEPGRGIKVLRQGNRFTSNGDTILGSDDKSAIAALVEAWRVIQENHLAYVPLEFIFTTCEEVGLLGAKALHPHQIRAKMGYALDSSGFGRVIIGAPASNRFCITVQGRAAHAGLHPEKGINAIILAAKALALAPCGRIDSETTVNFGCIQGGTATNIVPEQVVIEGEVRSHSMAKLERLTKEIETAFRSVLNSWCDPSGQAQGVPELKFEVELDFPAMQLNREDAVIQRISDAAAKIGLPLHYESAGGGSDANILNGCGLATAIVATGMTNVHSTAEEVSLDDMTQLTQLVLALVTV
jgi:tripeptide aminopeptidase